MLEEMPLLIVTSPPYDKLRRYGGQRFDYRNVATESRNIIQAGGVIVWVVADQTLNGSETGTSFLHALYFKDCLGLNLHDTMYYKKDPPPLTHSRYEQAIEYMFVFSKGKPKRFNPIMEVSLHAGRKNTSTRRHDLLNLEASHKRGENVKCKKIKGNCWHYSIGKNKSTVDDIAFEHPAIFPEALAQDHIVSWSNENDLVMDPMCGSGTTCKMAEKLHRRWIGIEIEEKYCEIAAKRIEKERQQLKLFV